MGARTMQKPVFVKLEKYNEVIKAVKAMKTKVHNAKMMVHKVQKLKRDEDVELELWQASLEQVERKIAMIDSSLQEPQKT